MHRRFASSALLMQADTSVIKDGAAMPDLIMVSQIQLQPKNVDATSAIQGRDKARHAEGGGGLVAGVPRYLRRRTHQITTVRSMKNWAEIDAGPVTRRLLSPPEYAEFRTRGMPWSSRPRFRWVI